MVKSITLSLLLILCSIQASTQNWEIFNTSNSSIPGNDISAIAFDLEGKTWVGTYQHGLANYDGSDWQSFNDTGLDEGCLTYIADISVDPNNSDVWVANSTECGLAQYTNETWTSFGFAFNYGMQCVEIDGASQVWIGNSANGGLFHFTEGEYLSYNENNSDNPNDYVHAIGIVNEEKRWVVGTHELALMNGEEWEIIPPETFADLPSFVFVTDVAIENDSITWFAHTRGVAKFNALSNAWEHFNESNSPLINMGGSSCNIVFRSMTIDALGHKYITNPCTGVLKFDGNNWESINMGNSLIPSDLTTVVEVDNTQNLWIGTDDAGMAKLTLLTLAPDTSIVDTMIVDTTFVSGIGELSSQMGAFVSQAKVLNLTIEHPLKPQLKLFDFNGSMVLEEAVQNQEQISLHHLPAGIYVLHLQNGNNWLVKKILVY